MVKNIIDSKQKRQIAKLILLDLPEWFGIPEYTKDYIEKSSQMPFFATYDQNQPIGFAALKSTSQSTAEVYCMGILKSHHRKGYGQALMHALETYAKVQGFKFLQVKTVEQGRYDIYDQTNAFYKSVGFYELEVFPDLWDEWNPCQIFVKAI